jgi:hypothetical protein
MKSNRGSLWAIRCARGSVFFRVNSFFFFFRGGYLPPFFCLTPAQAKKTKWKSWSSGARYPEKVRLVRLFGTG